MKILVTGGAGFIGSHVVPALVARGDDVVVLDCFDAYYDPALKRANVSAFASDVQLVEGDLRDRAALEAALRGVDSVLHLAARPGVRASIADPSSYIDNNVLGTQRLLDAMRDLGVGRMVYASSSSVYGARGIGAFREDDPVTRPVSPYAATKLAGELLCHAASATWGLQASCLRLFTVYGPRQRPEMAIHLFARRALAGDAIQRFGDGSSRRDYTYVEDIARGMLAALDRPEAFAVYNLGSGRPVTLASLLEQLGGVLGAPLRLEVLPDQPGDVPNTWADTALARSELRWTPQVRLDEGLRRFVEWLRG